MLPPRALQALAVGGWAVTAWNSNCSPRTPLAPQLLSSHPPPSAPTRTPPTQLQQQQHPLDEEQLMTRLGTPMYAAPEVLQHAAIAVPTAVDVYGFGYCPCGAYIYFFTYI